MHVTIGKWLVLALASGAGIFGLLLASSGAEGILYELGLGLFVSAVVYISLLIKRHFDRLDQARH